MPLTLEWFLDRIRPVSESLPDQTNRARAGAARTAPGLRAAHRRHLAGRLGVDERTVRRYAEHLADLGIPVQSQRDRYGGYRLAPSYKLPPLMLTDDEALVVVLGIEAGRRSGLLTAQSVAADSALARVRRVLAPALARRLEALREAAVFTASGRAGTAPLVGVLLDLADAASARRTVLLDYTSFLGEVTRRRLDP